MNAQPAEFLEAADAKSLATLRKGARGHVVAIAEPAEAAGQALAAASSSGRLARRLLELGFVPGEPIEILEEVRPGGDPIAVRVGCSIFALRRREACAVLVAVQTDPY